MISQGKRKLEAVDTSSDQKRAKTFVDSPVRRDLLERCYGKVTTLREYVLLKLPVGSRLRRKKVASIGDGDEVGETEKQLSRLLDTSLVGFADEQQSASEDTRWEQWLAFSQKEDESYVSLSDGIAGSVFSQSEVSIAIPYWRAITDYSSRLWISLCGYSFLEIHKLVDGPDTYYVTASENQLGQTIKGRPVSLASSACTPIHT